MDFEQIDSQFELNVCLNNSRDLLVKFARGKDNSVAALAVKNLLMLGLARSSVEDFLILTSILEEKEAAGCPIDLREELKILNSLQGNDDKSDDAKEIDLEKQVQESEPIKMRMLHEGWDLFQKEHSWATDGEFIYVAMQRKGLFKVRATDG